MTLAGDEAGYELAYEAGLEAVDEQATTLRETRDRAGALLSAATVAGSLAVGLVFTSGRASNIDWLGATGAVLAVAGFTGIVVATVMIWYPTEGQFVRNAGVIIDTYIEGSPPLELPELHRELALWLGKEAESNRRMLEFQLRVFTLGLWAMLLEIAGLLLALGDAAYG